MAERRFYPATKHNKPTAKRGRPPEPDHDDRPLRIIGPDGEPQQLGVDAQYHPLSYFSEPHTAERVKRACCETKPMVGLMPPLALFKYTREVLERMQ